MLHRARPTDLTELYQHLNLSQTPQDGARKIRVLSILPANTWAELRASLSILPLCEESQYEALSYTWGEFTRSRSMIINDDYRIQISDNLHDALRRLRQHGVRTIWVDALCINQRDNQERMLQVGWMGDIYRYAQCVNVWLGEHHLWSSSLNWMRLLAAARSKAQEYRWDSEHIMFYINDDARKIDLAMKYTGRPWHSRAWVMQEFILAREVFLFYGTTRLQFDEDLMSKLGLVSYASSFQGQDFDTFQKRVMDRVAERSRKESSVCNLIATMKGTNASDSRDYVYSFLGLLRESEASLIEPDYESPASLAFAKATFASIKVQDDLQILGFVRQTQEHPAEPLPSWVFNFACNTEMSASSWFGHDMHSYSQAIISGMAEQVNPSMEDDETLFINAISCDVIQSVAAKMTEIPQELNARYSHGFTDIREYAKYHGRGLCMITTLRGFHFWTLSEIIEPVDRVVFARSVNPFLVLRQDGDRYRFRCLAYWCELGEEEAKHPRSSKDVSALLSSLLVDGGGPRRYSLI